VAVVALPSPAALIMPLETCQPALTLPIMGVGITFKSFPDNAEKGGIIQVSNTALTMTLSPSISVSISLKGSRPASKAAFVISLAIEPALRQHMTLLL